jgi:hypothetical protein
VAASLIPDAHIIGDKIVGKSEFVVQSVIGALEANLDRLALSLRKHVPITVVGCEGNIGTGVVEHLRTTGYQNVAVTDVALSEEDANDHRNKGVKVLPAPRPSLDPSQFRPGINLIAYNNKAVAYGLQDCPAEALPDNSIILTASNNMLPTLSDTVDYSAALVGKNTLFYPGIIMTTGGQYTAVADRTFADLAELPGYEWSLDASGKKYHWDVKTVLCSLNYKMLYAQTTEAFDHAIRVDGNLTRFALDTCRASTASVAGNKPVDQGRLRAHLSRLAEHHVQSHPQKRHSQEHHHSQQHPTP